MALSADRTQATFANFYLGGNTSYEAIRNDEQYYVLLNADLEDDSENPLAGDRNAVITLLVGDVNADGIVDTGDKSAICEAYCTDNGVPACDGSGECTLGPVLPITTSTSNFHLDILNPAAPFAKGQINGGDVNVADNNACDPCTYNTCD